MVAFNWQGCANAAGFNTATYPLVGSTCREIFGFFPGITNARQSVPLVVPLGLDIAKADPTGTWAVTPEGLFEIGYRVGGLKLPTLLVQEGGYNIRSLGRNAARMLTGRGDRTCGRTITPTMPLAAIWVAGTVTVTWPPAP